MAKLEIEVVQKTSGGAGAAGGGAFTAADAATMQRTLESANRLQVVLLKGAKDYGKELKTAVEGLAAGMQRGQDQSAKLASALGLGIQRSLEQAGQKGGAEAGKAASKSFAQNFNPFGNGVTSGSITAVRAFGRFGQEAASAFGVAFQGGLLNGNLLRGAGGLLGAGSRLAGEISRGLTQAVGGAIEGLGSLLLPSLGKALGGVSKVFGAALSVAGSLGGVLANAAGDIAGALGDALGTALKVSLGAAAAVGIYGIKRALTENDFEGEFGKLAKASGVSAAQGLKKLSDATRGTVSNLELMRLANLAAREGVVSSIDEFSNLAEAARLLGKGVGTDATRAIESFVRSIGQLSGRSIAVLGVTQDEKIVFEALAKSLGTTTDKLTEQQKKQALLADALAISKERIRDTGVQSDDASDKLDRFRTMAANTASSIGRALVPALDKLLGAAEPAASALARFVDREADAASGKLAKAVGDAEGPLKRVADFIDRIKSEDIWALAKNGSEELWVRFRAAASGAFTYVELRAQQAFKQLEAFALDNAVALGFLTGGPAGAIAGGVIKNTAHERAGGGVFDDENAAVKQIRGAADALGQQASATSFSPQGTDLARINELAAQRAALLDEISRRNPVGSGAQGAASRPAADPATRPTLVSQGQIPDTQPQVAYRPGGIPNTLTANNSAFQIASQLSTVTGYDQIVKLLPILNTVGAAIESSAEPAKELERQLKRADDFVQRVQIDGLTRDIVAPFEKAAKLAEQGTSSLEEALSKQKSELAASERLGKELKKQLAEGTARVNDAYQREVDSIAKQRDEAIARINAAVTSRRDELVGLAGGIGPDESSIPAKLRRAATKARRAANKDRRDSLRNLSDGQTTDELAANGAAGLLAVFQQQATKEIRPSEAIAAELDKAAAAMFDAEQKRSEAVDKLTKTLTDQMETASENAKREAAAVDELTKAVLVAKNDAEAQKKKIEALERAIAAISR